MMTMDPVFFFITVLLLTYYTFVYCLLPHQNVSFMKADTLFGWLCMSSTFINSHHCDAILFLQFYTLQPSNQDMISLCFNEGRFLIWNAPCGIRRCNGCFLLPNAYGFPLIFFPVSSSVCSKRSDSGTAVISKSPESSAWCFSTRAISNS